MKDAVRRLDYWYAVVPAGGPQALLQALAAEKVDLVAFLSFPLPDGRTQIDIFPRSGAALEQAAKRAGITLSSRKGALFVDGANRPGALAEHLSRVSTAGIPVTAATAIATAGGGYGFLVFVKQDRLDDAARALQG